MGVKWSEKNLSRPATRLITPRTACSKPSPTFAQLELKYLNWHGSTFVKTLELDLTGRELAMTDCWVNIMPQQVAHSMHLHSASDHQRHLLRADAERLCRLEVRRSATGEIHGRAVTDADASPANRA